MRWVSVNGISESWWFRASVVILSLSVGSGRLQAEVYSWWKLNEGHGDVVLDSGPLGHHGDVFNALAGGFGNGGSVWYDDPQRGTVLSFNGAWVEAGTIPLMTLETDFTWAFWARQDESQPTPANQLILGNRYNSKLADTAPREFIKFTPNRFEYHVNAGGTWQANPDGSEQFADDLQYLDCDYCPQRHIPSVPSEWIHHAVVKDGTTLTYYRNGEVGNYREIATPQMSPAPLPILMGGQGGQELWRGFLSDVRLWDQALTPEELRASIVEGRQAGDFDGDGDLTVADIDQLLTAIKANDHTSALDLSGDGVVDRGDLGIWVRDLKKTWIGDANLDGQFSSQDLVVTFAVGKYESGLPASWAEGDWTGNGAFDTQDFVAAFVDGGYEAGPRTALVAVPEPAGVSLLAWASLGLAARWRAHRRDAGR